MRRNRSDSVTSAVKAAMDVLKPELEPPKFVSLSIEAYQFWPGIIHARSRDEWRDVDLVIAAQLAECQASIESESRVLRDEGMIVVNDRGTKIENPRNRVVQTLASREMALMRSLLMGGKITGVDERNFEGARKSEVKARKAQKHLEHEEDVLA